MAQIGEFIRWVTLAGEPVIVKQWTVTPLAQSLTVRWSRGGFVWNRPIALLIAKDGQTKRMPIPDVARGAQLVLLSISILLSLILLAVFYKEATV